MLEEYNFEELNARKNPYTKMLKAPYMLIIHTDSYTGNFDRELIAYSIGILDEMQESFGYEFKASFWQNYTKSGCKSLEEYNKMKEKINIEELDDMLLEADMLLKGKSSDDIEKSRNKVKEERYKNNINRLYDTYLCYTYQNVDDWLQDTFYNIEHYKGSYECDSIRIQLTKPLNEDLEKLIIERIKNFFESDAYNIIRDYQWLNSFGSKREIKDNYKLLDLELVDSDYNLIKKYV